VFAECLSVELAGDQRRLTGSGSALEALCDDVLYKSTYFTFLLLLYINDELLIVSSCGAFMDATTRPPQQP